MRILVTGSRAWPKGDFNQIEFVLKNYLLSHTRPGDEVTFVVGDCPTGVDSYINSDDFRAAMLAGRIVNVECHKADWNSGGAYAGLDRNERMAKLGAEICFAFTYGGRMQSRGTRHCARQASERDIPVKWINHVGPDMGDQIPHQERRGL